jgi:hypothetical protein
VSETRVVYNLSAENANLIFYLKLRLMKKTLAAYNHRAVYINFLNIILEISISGIRSWSKKKAIKSPLVDENFFKDLYEEIW